MCSAGALRVHCGCIEGALEDAFVRALPGAFADALQVHSNVYFMCNGCAFASALQVPNRTCQILRRLGD